MNKQTRGRFSSAFLVMQCFNVAAITALGVWHGYAFYARAAAPVATPTSLVLIQSSAVCCRPPQ